MRAARSRPPAERSGFHTLPVATFAPVAGAPQKAQNFPEPMSVSPQLPQTSIRRWSHASATRDKPPVSEARTSALGRALKLGTEAPHVHRPRELDREPGVHETRA